MQGKPFAVGARVPAQTLSQLQAMAARVEKRRQESEAYRQRGIQQRKAGK